MHARILWQNLKEGGGVGAEWAKILQLSLYKTMYAYYNVTFRRVRVSTCRRAKGISITYYE